ncbi:MAG: translational GTPase TypA [Clostridia bacterium]|nr:translational GTPase TypA [Clostridia bacterium]
MTIQIRNIAIIAHVDHGKTTLVDELLKQSGTFRSNQQVAERVMDSNALERERGITILAKNTAVIYQDIKINIVDTPGHADFGGEVERALMMVDGVLLIVDAYEGPMAQTKFVLRKALELNLRPIVVINKIDRPDTQPDKVVDQVFDLFVELDASEEQLDFPIVYASAKQGFAKLDLEDQSVTMGPLFETIVNNIPAPCVSEGAFQMLVTNIDYDSFLGRYAIGKINRGTLTTGMLASVIRQDGKITKSKVGKLYTYDGLKKVEVSHAISGDIVAIAGLEEVNIGETVADINHPEQLPVLIIDEPTLTMTFSVNTGPFAGLEGDHITSRKLRERLYRELESNVSLRVEDTESPDAFQISGRGELHLSILIENMRREGYELQVSKPKVIYKKVADELHEPMELLTVDIPDEAVGSIMENLSNRKAEMLNMCPNGRGQTRLEFNIPARGLIGFRSEFMTITRGYGILNHIFNGYSPAKGEIATRYQGALISFETGESTTYGLLTAEDRGTFFIIPGTKVYEGMIVGQNNRTSDLELNICKKKHLTNVRASGSDDTVKLKEPRIFTLEEAIEFIADDELVEVTPQNIRMRKRLLQKHERERAAKLAVAK